MFQNRVQKAKVGGVGSSRDCFAFSNGPQSFGWALIDLGVEPKVGEAVWR